MNKSLTGYVGLIRELAITDFKLKYQGSVIGYLWSLAKPLAIFAILYLVFTVFVKVGSGIPHYPVFLLLGVVLWSYFAESTSIAMHSIVDKRDLIRKVYFPRIVLLLASSVSSMITLGLNLVIIFVFLFASRVFPMWSWLLFPFLLFELYLVSLGIAFFLAAWYVKFRDFAHIWEVLLQLGFYATPIIYPLSIIPHRYARLIMLSPLSQIIQDAKRFMINPDTPTTFTLHHGPLVLVPYLLPVALVFFGYRYFTKAASNFAEEI